MFPEGTGGFVNVNVLHSSRMLPSGASTVQMLHLFDPVLLSGEHGSRMEEKYILPLTASGVEMIPLDPKEPLQGEVLGEIQRAFELSGEDWGYEFRLREVLTEIWMRLLELARTQMEAGKGRKGDDERIKAMMVYVHGHYGETITVEQLAACAMVSRRGCFRLFQENLHMTPMEYIRSYRLQKACRMLAEGREPVTEIGAACGLGSSSYFGKVFREAFGCSPGEYRKNWHDRDKIGRK